MSLCLTVYKEQPYKKVMVVFHTNHGIWTLIIDIYENSTGKYFTYIYRQMIVNSITLTGNANLTTQMR